MSVLTVYKEVHQMRGFLSTLYFIGLVMLSTAVADIYNITAYGFIVLGGGFVSYAVVIGMLSYLKPAT